MGNFIPQNVTLNTLVDDWLEIIHRELRDILAREEDQLAAKLAEDEATYEAAVEEARRAVEQLRSEVDQYEDSETVPRDLEFQLRDAESDLESARRREDGFQSVERRARERDNAEQIDKLRNDLSAKWNSRFTSDQEWALQVHDQVVHWYTGILMMRALTSHYSAKWNEEARRSGYGRGVFRYMWDSANGDANIPMFGRATYPDAARLPFEKRTPYPVAVESLPIHAKAQSLTNPALAEIISKYYKDADKNLKRYKSLAP